MNYYNQIKDVLINNEVYKKVKDYSENKNELNSYYEVGKLLVEVQGGEARAKYGNKLIKEYSERLTRELGKGYGISNLKNMRQFYLTFKKSQAQPGLLSWSHIIELLRLNSKKEINYYIYITEKENLSYRKLNERIKSNEYERIGYKEELEEPKVNTLIKNPIIIKTVESIKDKITEKVLHQLILNDLDNFLKELGIGFSYIGHEVKIKIGNTYHSIDFLLFNIEYNAFIVVEIKITEFKVEYIGQVTKYMNYVDKNIKKITNDKTIGIIICKRENKYVMEYCSDNRIYTTTYKLKEIIKV
ncbi:MAG: DUF1016 family protein [Bacilli bacterium]|nr:DUF1016 family protein [Bacilli bacterium]